jgi:hypothetical protein
MRGQMCAALDLASIAASVRRWRVRKCASREEWLNKFLGQAAVRATASQLANLIKPT